MERRQDGKLDRKSDRKDSRMKKGRKSKIGKRNQKTIESSCGSSQEEPLISVSAVPHCGGRLLERRQGGKLGSKSDRKDSRM